MLSLQRLRGQCYDGASAMSGIKSGVAKQICDIEPRALFTHCYGAFITLSISLFPLTRTVFKWNRVGHPPSPRLAPASSRILGKHM